MIRLNRQQTIILQALRQAGETGVNSYDLRFKFHLIQAPVRIKELKQHGFIIASRDKKDRSVDYILVHEPQEKAELFGDKKEYKPLLPSYEFFGNHARPKEEPKQEVMF